MSKQVEVAAAGDEEALRDVCKEARDLLARLHGPVRRLSVQRGDAHVEIEWEPTANPSAPNHGGSAPATAPAEAAEVEGRHVVTAPLVGAFYRAPEPGAPPFVQVGDLVEPGQDLAIIEAMKMMNRIPCEVSGRITAILVEDGVMVEFGQELMHVDPADGDG